MRLLLVLAQPHYFGTLCAGTILRHVDAGDEVIVVSLTQGECMTDLVTPEELARINRDEAERAAEILGVKELRILEHADCQIRPEPDLLMELNMTFRELKPDLVLTHWPEDTMPDFRATSSAVSHACFLALLVSGHWARTKSHWTSKLYGFAHPGLSYDFRPTHFIDISDVLERKIASVDCFAIHRRANFADDVELYRSHTLAANRVWGIESGVNYAEAYGQLPCHEVHNKAVGLLVD
jgi:N-acetylglucosamine malate deacetylase 1